MEPVFDPEFIPTAKSKPGKTWTSSLRKLGRLAAIVALGGVAIVQAQNPPRRWRNRPLPPPPPLVYNPLFDANGNPITQWANPVPTPDARDPFIRPAPEGIDDRFLVSAPQGIDERMIVNPYPAPRMLTPPNGPVVPYYIVPAPAPPR